MHRLGGEIPPAPRCSPRPRSARIGTFYYFRYGGFVTGPHQAPPGFEPPHVRDAPPARLPLHEDATFQRARRHHEARGTAPRDRREPLVSRRLEERGAAATRVRSPLRTPHVR